MFNYKQHYIDASGRTRLLSGLAASREEKMDKQAELKQLLEDIIDKKLTEKAAGGYAPAKRRLIDVSRPGEDGTDENDRNLVVGKTVQALYRLQQGDTSAFKELQDMGVSKAMSEGSDADGGYLVPQTYMDSILRIPEISGLEAFCRRIPMTSKTRQYPDLEAGTACAWKDEAEALDLSEPTLKSITLSAKKVGSYVIASNELLEDASVDVMDFLQTLFFEAMGKEIDDQILNGTGSPCSGILTAACGHSVVMENGLTNFSSMTGSHLSEMIAKLPAPVLQGSRFIMHKDVYHHVRTLQDKNNQFIYSPIGGGQSGTIWGYPVSISDAAPSVSGANTAFVAFGNFNYFLLGDRLTFSLATDPYTKFLENQTRIRWLRRLALQIGKSTAFCRLITAAS